MSAPTYICDNGCGWGGSYPPGGICPGCGEAGVSQVSIQLWITSDDEYEYEEEDEEEDWQ